MGSYIVKKSNLFLGLFLCGTLLVGCQSGTSSNSTPAVVLSAGVYNVTYANLNPSSCSALFESTAYSNGLGQVCDDVNYSVNCRNVNLAATPCFSSTQTDGSGSYISTSWSSCALSQNETSMTANLNYVMSTPLFDITCTANMTLTQQESM